MRKSLCVYSDSMRLLRQIVTIGSVVAARTYTHANEWKQWPKRGKWYVGQNSIDSQPYCVLDIGKGQIAGIAAISIQFLPKTSAPKHVFIDIDLPREFGSPKTVIALKVLGVELTELEAPFDFGTDTSTFETRMTYKEFMHISNYLSMPGTMLIEANGGTLYVNTSGYAAALSDFNECLADAHINTAE